MMADFQVVDMKDLIPAERPTQSVVMMDPNEIEFADVGPPPTPQLMLSIRQYGIQVPLTVIDLNDDATEPNFFLIAGRRRLKCALEIDLECVPVLIQTDVNIDTTILTDHAHRHANPAAELAAIERLQEEGHTEKQIAAASGMSVGTIRARLRLRSLCAELRDAFDSGKITLGVAEGLVKLSRDEQTTLAVQFEETGMLTSKDVKNARRVQRAASLDDLDFDDLPPINADTSEQQAKDRASLDQFIELTGSDPTNAQSLAGVGIACIDVGRIEDAREVFQRILELQRQSA